jgi:hypothetical protein
MQQTTFHGRRAVSIENQDLRVTLTPGGGHIAEIYDKAARVNPLWVPIWRTVEPRDYSPARHPEFGGAIEASLLASILGHNLCADIFGAPSEAERHAGLPVHGEAAIAEYKVDGDSVSLRCAALLEQARIQFERRIRLDGRVVHIEEIMENLSATDRPVAWTQHATLGRPFLERGVTEFRVSATRSKVIDGDFTEGKGRQRPGAEFDWPFCPARDGGVIDLRVYESAKVSGGFTAHLMDPAEDTACFVAFSPKFRLAFGYLWRREDFPWLGRWEENHARAHAPWNGSEMTLGMEFGVSPFPETRRQMVERGRLFGTPTFRWLPAMSKLLVRYAAFTQEAAKIPAGPPEIVL